MTRTIGAAVGAVIVILFLVTVASRLSAPLSTPSTVEAARTR
jgi:hypothetical protein